jgi:beta-aspartyl-peptidase (threonine type)
MRKRSLLLCLGAGACLALAFLLLAGPTGQQSVVSASGRDAKEAIRQVLDRQAAAWNKGDLEGFMAGYWKSPELTFFSGKSPERGWQATLDRYRKRYQGEGREMGKLTFGDIRIDLLGADAALVRGRWQLARTKDNPGGLFTLIFRKLPEGWRIVHDHTSS